MAVRLLILAFCLAASSGYIRYKMEAEEVPLRRSLAEMPDRMGRWVGLQSTPLTEPVLAVLGVDEYVNRLYRASQKDVVSLYIGYYGSQRDGDTIHSPMNCLPGAGWLPMSTTYSQISVPERPEPITVKRVLIQKGLDKQVVLYWYHSHGRVVGNEYMSKILMVYDAVRLNRSDAALVRVISPLGQTEDAEHLADERAIDFVRALFTSVDQYLPL